jgi:hypothetical protein
MRVVMIVEPNAIALWKWDAELPGPEARKKETANFKGFNL